MRLALTDLLWSLRLKIVFDLVTLLFSIANDGKCRSISYLSSLLDKEDRSVRIAAGEALALIFEIGSFEKFSSSEDGSIQGGNKPRESIVHIQGLRAKVLNQVRSLSVEAGGKGTGKKDLNSQRNLFKDVLEFLEVPRVNFEMIIFHFSVIYNQFIK